MKKNVFVALMLSIGLGLWSAPIFAQNAHRDHIILLDGEKIPGTIVRNYDHVQYKRVRFETVAGQSEEYTPSQLTGFSLENGRYFESKNLPDIQETVFVQVIFSGNFDLLFWAGKYYIQNPLDIVELKPVEMYSMTYQTDAEKVHNSYIGVLSRHMAGHCGMKLKNDIVRTRLFEEDLISMLEKYHKCEEAAYTIHVERIPSRVVRPILMAGGTYHSLLAQEVVHTRSDKFENAMAFNLQGLLRMRPSRRHPKMFFDLGIGYSSFSAFIDSEYGTTLTTYVSREKMRYQRIYVPLFLNHSIVRREKIDFYGGLGFELARASRFYRDHHSSGNIPEDGQNNVMGLRARIDFIRPHYYPAVKLGLDMGKPGTIGLLSEFQLGFLPEASEMTLASNLAAYHLLMASWMVGVRF
jgi:hypothetical protein